MLHNQIQEHCKVFKLPRILEHYQSVSDEASKDNLPYSEYLLKLFDLEKQGRLISSKNMLLKMAGFPKVKTLDMFDYKSSSVNQTQINEIATLRFIDLVQNILFFGPSGVGKTHLAQSIGYIATQQRIRTKFITMSDLLFQLEAAQLQGKLENYFSRVIKSVKLLIIDEFGYIKLNENQANLFFQIVNKRYENSSIIITSNLTFTKWKEILNNDEALTTAILDRLIHHSHIINIQGESYRLKQKKKAGILDISCS
jgi:DNA replication protein DnaC